MVRYLASGYRNFKEQPVPIGERLNWQIYLVAEGKLHRHRRDYPSRKEESEPIHHCCSVGSMSQFRLGSFS